MAEYISKETLQEKLNRKKAGPATKRYTEGWNDAILMVKSMIHGEKAVDVAPVRHGRWVEHKHFHHDHYIDSTYECSECNVEEPLTSDYCPNCGAKMDLEERS